MAFLMMIWPIIYLVHGTLLFMSRNLSLLVDQQLTVVYWNQLKFAKSPGPAASIAKAHDE
jgi:hypothetical protein